MYYMYPNYTLFALFSAFRSQYRIVKPFSLSKQKRSTTEIKSFLLLITKHSEGLYIPT